MCAKIHFKIYLYILKCILKFFFFFYRMGIFVIKSANSGAAAESRRTAINLSSKNNTEVCSCLTYAAFI